MKLIFQKIINFFQSKKLKQYENENFFLNRLLKSEKEISKHYIEEVEDHKATIESLLWQNEKLKEQNKRLKKTTKKKAKNK